MRVISQDGTLDMPYEEVIIQRFKSRIYFLNKNLTGVESLSDDMQIAEYSTEAKAKKKNTRIGTTRIVTDTAELASLMLKGGLNC